ncbi:hypothetical protein [Rhodococcus aerolatus]
MMQDAGLELFERWWADAAQKIAVGYFLEQGRPERARDVQEQSKKVRAFRCNYTLTMEFLRFVDAHPGLGLNEIKRDIHWRWRGNVEQYRNFCRDMGYLTVKSGAGRKHTYTVIAWPEKPAERPAKKMTIDELRNVVGSSQMRV